MSVWPAASYCKICHFTQPVSHCLSNPVYSREEERMQLRGRIGGGGQIERSTLHLFGFPIAVFSVSQGTAAERTADFQGSLVAFNPLGSNALLDSRMLQNQRWFGGPIAGNLVCKGKKLWEAKQARLCLQDMLGAVTNPVRFQAYLDASCTLASNSVPSTYCQLALKGKAQQPATSHTAEQRHYHNCTHSPLCAEGFRSSLSDQALGCACRERPTMV